MAIKLSAPPVVILFSSSTRRFTRELVDSTVFFRHGLAPIVLAPNWPHNKLHRRGLITAMLREPLSCHNGRGVEEPQMQAAKLSDNTSAMPGWHWC